MRNVKARILHRNVTEGQCYLSEQMSCGVSLKQRLLSVPESLQQQLACCRDSPPFCSLKILLEYPLQALGIRRAGEVWGLPTGPSSVYIEE